MHGEWAPKIITDLRQQTDYINQLSMGKIPAIVIPKIFNKTRCQEIISRIISNHGISSGLGLTRKIGESVNSYNSNKFEYFQNVKASNDNLKTIFSSDDPRCKMRECVTALCGTNIEFAQEKTMPYSNGIIRFHDPGTCVHIHRDHAVFEAPNFSISNLTGQMSAVLQLQAAESGGNLSVFNKFWTKSDEKFRNVDFGYSKNVVNQVPHTSIDCNQGDLIIINPKKYHSISMIKGRLQRITLGFFFGRDIDFKLYAWS